MNAVITQLVGEAFEKGLLSIERLEPAVFALKAHVLGMSFTLTKIRITMEANTS